VVDLSLLNSSHCLTGPVYRAISGWYDHWKDDTKIDFSAQRKTLELPPEEVSEDEEETADPNDEKKDRYSDDGNASSISHTDPGLGKASAHGSDDEESLSANNQPKKTTMLVTLVIVQAVTQMVRRRLVVMTRRKTKK
jgi:hypothetical protein